ncbi:MAG: phosphoribosylformylglycinamidine synthase II [Alphaproteobacteria bacterium RIFCSPHIGHO2_12_FULL_45_9]|nr:MAG: phosphoribosylformylglycinamidine synthase II [Alphaproteobacteria bacterium RIFCSPHIGHO2_02_FULL_46_13]OFW99392.1 MAG: phosphoribosylformylglycinamidine synthase II [Alphaproteobacteria bacterium RIFCSPHIGHO2_12_FULL_45_9]
MTAVRKEKPVIQEPAITAALAKSFGMTADEFQLVQDILGRMPTYTELGVFSVMWSEHCSYKSSRIHLKKLPTKGKCVIQGPGEGAGVIDIGDGQAALFKMESHNHPSYIEPYQGAATGVGGIMRDVFTMGGRPIANLNALRFGEPSHPKTKTLVKGVVAGISGYGNSTGVPTVGGETNFHKSFNGNNLVNAMCVGLAEQDAIYYARGAGVGQPIVYVGSKTGRDGIHGATMASAEFVDGAEDNRPTVQVGDPFTEKLLIEACLELMQSDAIISIQDMGAAGLTSSSVEIASKGEIGVVLNLDDVPQREQGMVPYEIMLSESQERMLMILKPGSEDTARKIIEKWDLDFAVIGYTTDDKRLVLNMYGEEWCNIPVPPLVDQSPLYDRPSVAPKKPAAIDDTAYPLGHDGAVAALKKLMGCPDLSSKRWIWEQYDSLVMGETIFSPGIANTQALKAGDAALVKIPNKAKALAMTSDVTPRYVHADPFEGGKQAVCETWRNITATGATPLAITNNLNFGNPEKPEIMGQIVTSLEGISAACIALDYPIASGNVSLYNETSGTAIQPTPAIGGVGLIADYKKSVGLGFAAEGETILVIGTTRGHLGQSLYLRELHGKEEGSVPPTDLLAERANGDFVRANIMDGTITACHDVSDGGLLVAVAEMAMAGQIGATVESADSNLAGFWFGEDQSRYVVTTKDADHLISAAKTAGIPILKIGTTSGKSLVVDGTSISVADLIAINEEWLPKYMNS